MISLLKELLQRSGLTVIEWYVITLFKTIQILIVSIITVGDNYENLLQMQLLLKEKQGLGRRWQIWMAQRGSICSSAKVVVMTTSSMVMMTIMMMVVVVMMVCNDELLLFGKNSLHVGGEYFETGILVRITTILLLLRKLS